MENQTNKNTWVWVVGVVVLVLVAGYYFMTSSPFINKGGEERGSTSTQPTFNKEVPEVVVQKEATKPIEVDVPKDVKTQFGAYEIKGEGGAFQPAELIVPEGGRVQINFTAVDADYDISFAPPIGAYLKAKKGETATFGFDASNSKVGAYTFVCKDFCPSGKEMKGTLVIK